jgi:hypothetical protein
MTDDVGDVRWIASIYNAGMLARHVATQQKTQSRLVTLVRPKNANALQFNHEKTLYIFHPNNLS